MLGPASQIVDAAGGLEVAPCQCHNRMPSGSSNIVAAAVTSET